MKKEMVSVDKFVDRLLEVRARLSRLPQKIFSGIWPNDFPSSESLKLVLHASYFASLEQYEGRNVQTVLNWNHPAFGRAYVHEFSIPSTDFSAKNLRQLAQVADGVSGYLSLVIYEQQLAISGVEYCWSTNRTVMRNGFEHGVKISIKGPGHIEYQEGSLAVAYKKGRHFRLRHLLTCSAIEKWVIDADRALQSEAISTLKNHSLWGEITAAPQFPTGVMKTFLRSAISTIEKTGHGGTLIILPNEEAATCIDIRFPAASFDLKFLVSKFGEASLFAQKNGFSTSSLFSPTLVNEDLLMSRVEEYGVAFAKLANCDGAIVMTRDAKLLGFGGIIQSPSREMLSVLNQPLGGARHTSAKWLCESVPGSIALVVSSDRTITLIHSTNGKSEILKDFVVW